MLLEITSLTKQFGGLTAVSPFDMYVREGEIVGLIGPNFCCSMNLLEA